MFTFVMVRRVRGRSEISHPEQLSTFTLKGRPLLALGRVGSQLGLVFMAGGLTILLVMGGGVSIYLVR